MRFAAPWVLLLVPLLLWFLRRRSVASVTVPSVRLWPDRVSWKVRYLWVPPALRRAAMVFILIALARPQAGSTYQMQVTEGIAIQMLIDVSSSMEMNVKDRGGERSTRMELAKTMAERFIAGDGDRLKGRPDDLIGLITFARYADTRSPLTFGHDALLQILRHLEVQERPNEDGTAYGDALALAAARLKNPEELAHGKNPIDAGDIKSRVIILLTDGENNAGSHLPEEAAGLAKLWGCRIYAISLGDADADGPGIENLSSAEKVLQHISVETGGVFRQAHDSESLLAVYSEIDRLERSRISTRSADTVAEWFWLPVSLALGSLFFALTLEATLFRVVP
jgi:Ca-activated chloride channel family protein